MWKEIAARLSADPEPQNHTAGRVTETALRRGPQGDIGEQNNTTMLGEHLQLDRPGPGKAGLPSDEAEESNAHKQSSCLHHGGRVYRDFVFCVESNFLLPVDTGAGVTDDTMPNFSDGVVITLATIGFAVWCSNQDIAQVIPPLVHPETKTSLSS